MRPGRHYESMLGARFVQVKNISVYPPQVKNPKGERHEDLGFFSYDNARKAIVFRQFHVEGFVNQYRSETVSGERIVFITESIENIPDGWRARETYEITGEDSFVERFELAAPGKEFDLYSENRLQRVVQQPYEPGPA